MTAGEFNHIRVKQETKDWLDRVKAPGQSYDGLIRELLAAAEWMLMPPKEGPPLPRRFGRRWPWRTGKGRPNEEA